MQTERRWGMRKAVDVDVMIDNQPVCLLHGRIGNISIGGLFVKTTPQALDTDAPVELVLLLHENGGTRVYRMPAVVVRRAEDGAGLIFDRYNIDAFRTLAFLLKGSRGFGTRRQKQALRTKQPESGQGRIAAGLPGATTGADGAAALVGSISYNQSPGNGESTN